jgi:uncharacterized protein YbaR (Trm112 family)
VHLLLTDRLICPRCGPGFGLILRADVLEERQVEAGGLGCPNCREVYPVAAGVGDLRPPPREPTPPPEAGAPPDGEEVFRAQALLGLQGGAGWLLLLREASRYAPGLAERLPEFGVVATNLPQRTKEGSRTAESVIRVGTPLPFEARTLQGVLVEGPVSRGMLREAARVLAPGHRVVALNAEGAAGDILIASGLTVRLREGGVIVADR